MIWAIPIAMAVAGAAAAKAKHDRDVSNENSERELAAKTAQYSPWTGMTPGAIHRAGSQFGDIMSGSMQGFSSGMGMGGMMGGGQAPSTGAASGQMGDMSNQNWNKQMDYNQNMYKPKATNNYSAWGSMS